jgi:hypothetical protein
MNCPGARFRRDVAIFPIVPLRAAEHFVVQGIFVGIPEAGVEHP